MGTQTSGGKTTFVFQLHDPAPLPNDVTLTSDGTMVTSGGSQTSLALANLNYMMAGFWTYGAPPSNGGGALGSVVIGFQTPNLNIPTSGTANYVGNGGLVGSATAGVAAGTVFIPNGSGGIGVGALTGQANVSVDFASGSVSGSLSNMTATPSSGGTATPWNNVTLTGTLAGGNATGPNGAVFSGATATSGAPSGAGNYGLSSAAVGRFSGALYGSNSQELGAIWSLSEPGGNPNGKAALGFIAATKQ